MEIISKVNVPFFSSTIDTSTPNAAATTNSNMLIFKQVPDYLGNGILNVKVKFWANQENYTILLYCLTDDHNGMNLIYLTQIPCQADKYRYKYQTPQGTPCSGYLAVLVETSKMGNPIQTLPANDIMTVPGYAKFISSGPLTESIIISQVTSGIDNWTNSKQQQTFESFDLDGDQPVIPSLQQTISQLQASGVPSSYFTTDVQNNIQILINDYNQDAKEILRLARAQGSPMKKFMFKGQPLSYTCFWCKVGYGIAIALAACIITATFLALLPTGVGSAIIGGLSAYLVTWFGLAAATATTVSTGLVTTIGTVTTVTIAEILTNLPELLCETTEKCGTL